MRVLVTGGAGFIGSHVVDALLARGDDVAVLDDLASGRAGRLDPQVALHKLSITDAPALTEVVAGFAPELICHLAAQIDVRASVDAPAADAQVNILGTVNLLEAARLAGARVLFASSGGALYGRDAPIPSLEYNRLHGTRHSMLRLANVYGPRQDPAGEAGVITIFCARALAGREPTIYGDGRQTRDYVYVGDAVRAFLAAGDSGRPGTWNIGTGVEVSVLDLVDIIAVVAGRGIRPVFAVPRPGELQRSAVAPDRAAGELGWRAGTALDEGVRRVYQWIEAGAPDRASC